MPAPHRERRIMPKGTPTKLSKIIAKEYARSGARVPFSEIKKMIRQNPSLFWDNQGRSQVFVARMGQRVESRKPQKIKPQTIGERQAAGMKLGKTTKKLNSEEIVAKKFELLGRLFRSKSRPKVNLP